MLSEQVVGCDRNHWSNPSECARRHPAEPEATDQARRCTAASATGDRPTQPREADQAKDHRNPAQELAKAGSQMSKPGNSGRSRPPNHRLFQQPRPQAHIRFQFSNGVPRCRLRHSIIMLMIEYNTTQHNTIQNSIVTRLGPVWSSKAISVLTSIHQSMGTTVCAK